jgi:hypothetical protein
MLYFLVGENGPILMSIQRLTDTLIEILITI